MSKIDLLVSAIIIMGIFALGDVVRFMINKLRAR